MTRKLESEAATQRLSLEVGGMYYKYNCTNWVQPITIFAFLSTELWLLDKQSPFVNGVLHSANVLKAFLIRFVCRNISVS